jgi:thiosulfate dehydrogenase [quinone] large subunit
MLWETEQEEQEQEEEMTVMSATTTHTVHPELDAIDIPVEEEARAHKARYAMAAARIAIGWTFLWAFLDKTFGLGFATASEDGWVNGGSPTFGFLNFATEGKMFHEFFAGLPGTAADWLFMTGLLGIGVALILGIGMRIAAASGGLLLTLMWAAELRLENNPFVDDHIVYAIVLAALALYGAGRTWGLGRAWERLPMVQRLGFLK